MKKMTNITEYSLVTLILILLLAFASTSFAGTSYKTPPGQIWSGNVTGMIDGQMVLNAWEVENKAGELYVRSKVKMKIRSSSGYGSGYLTGTISGKVVNGELKAGFNGTANVSDGQAAVVGQLVGTLLDASGSGTYNLNTQVGQYRGKWTLERQDVKTDNNDGNGGTAQGQTTSNSGGKN